MEETILIVDDDPVNATLLMDQLQPLGFATEVCYSGEECLALLERKEFGLVLLDIMMPGLSGLEVLPRLRERFPPVELPVIMVTSMDNDEKVVEALGLGANDYIVKPVNIDVAVARITSLLSARKYHRKSLNLERLQAIRAMIITYNHEINNPMAVAMVEVSFALESGDTSNLLRAVKSLERITQIIRKIRDLTEGEIEVTDYLGEKMVKL